ncbi:hypothetical protein A2U01_0105320, partial [Trifolium medium]|nr:hypothetical protein [Trifolium medium]
PIQMAGTRTTATANDRIDELAQQMSAVLIRLDNISHLLDEQSQPTVQSSVSSPALDNSHRP